MQKLRQLIRRVHAPSRHYGLEAIGLTVAVGVSYLLAAMLSLALLTKPDGVAVFWPAAGIASGTLIALGSGVRVPVTLGVVTASIVASILGDRSLAAALAFALCNAAEPLLVAWLIKRHFGENFRLESLRSLLGFLAAAGIGPAVSGSVATVGFILFYSSGASVLTTWLNWFASDALGIIMVAPLLIGLGGLRGNFPQRWEIIEGMMTLVALVVVSAIAFGSPAHHWYTALPLAMLLAILLAAHCRPVFAAAAALILGSAVVWTTTFGIGGWGELPSLHDRAYAARTTLLAISTCTLVLAALFAERRQSEAALKDSNDRLQLALDSADLGVWSIDAKSGRYECDARNRRIHGYPPEAPPKTLAEARNYIHLHDQPQLEAAFDASKREGDNSRSQYRLAPTSSEDVVQERWISVEGTLVRSAEGQPVRWLGVTRDITARKRAEEHQQFLNSELDHRVKNVLATVNAIFTQTREASSTHADFVTGLDHRLKSLANTHELLSQGQWLGVSLAEIVRCEFAPYATDNTKVGGPSVTLKAEAAQAVAMVLHELTTNAVKYGAFSTRSGGVLLRWRWLRNGSHARLAIEWQEIGGPPVVPPSRSGYGTCIVRELIPFELAGSVDLTFPGDGLRCRLEIPADWISPGKPSDDQTQGLDAASSIARN
jgi:PAS domain S-box-containing protein